jgi:hypothetical protein
MKKILFIGLMSILVQKNYNINPLLINPIIISYFAAVTTPISIPVIAILCDILKNKNDTKPVETSQDKTIQLPF